MVYYFQKEQQREVLKDHLHLGGMNPEGERIDVNSSYFTRNGKPWIPVMGEFHFSRYNRKKWAEELSKMKAGGITLVSTYLFWIYHEEIEGEFDFFGDNDIRAFVLQCQRCGLEVVLRIGPWAHGECRNGGFPDWLLQKPYPLRKSNPGYLEQVRRWYGRIAEEVHGLFYKDGGNIVAIQLENEYGDSAEHLATLKSIALECGMDVPLFTVTGWNCKAGAKIPVDEVVPVFGGYCEAPWEKHTRQLLPSPHYFFNRMRNDSAIGADLTSYSVSESEGDSWQLPYERYPFATCELGGGIQVTHHRRPIIRPMDIYAVALIKLGDGNNLPGYYMYHGGTNKIGKRSTLQESRATKYPNDYAILSYDFQTALSEYGEVRGQYRLLNLLHLFLQDFQQEFAPLQAVDAVGKVEREDTASLRYGMRGDGQRGYVFINHYQRLTKLADVDDVVIDTGNVVFPPIDVKGEISFFLPFIMEIGERPDSVVLMYATAQPICHIDNVYFFVEIPGIASVYRFTDGSEVKADAGRESLFWAGSVGIVTLNWEEAKYLRRLDCVPELRDSGEALNQFTLYLGDGCDLYVQEGKLCCVQPGKYTYYRWNGEAFLPFTIGEPVNEPKVVWQSVTEAPFELRYGEELQIGGPRNVIWKRLIVEGSQGFISIEEDYDVAQIYVNGQLAADNYYYGRPWRVPAEILAGKECYLVMSERKDDFYREF